MSSSHNVFIKETLQHEYCKIEEIKISKALLEALLKEPIFGRSDYSDLPGAVVSHGSGCRSRLDTSRSPNSDPKKRKEAQLRQKAKREEITRRRDEKRLKQKARQHERRRQEEMMTMFQESYKMPNADSGLIISSSLMKFSSSKRRDDQDAFLNEKFKKNLSKEFNSCSRKSEGKMQNRVANSETLKKETEKTEKAQVSSSYEMNEENDSSVTSSTQLLVTQKTAVAKNRPQDSNAKNKVARAVPEIVDADSSTPHIGRSTRKKQRVSYEESPDGDTEEEEYFFKSSITIEKDQTVKKKSNTRQAFKKTQKSLRKSNNEQSPKVSSDNINATISQEWPSQVPVSDFEKNEKVLHNANPNVDSPFAKSFVINLDASYSSERPVPAAKSPHSTTSSSSLLGNFPHHHILNTRKVGSPPSSNCESNLTMTSGHLHSNGITALLMERQKSNNISSECDRNTVQSTLNFGHNNDRNTIQSTLSNGQNNGWNTAQSTHFPPVSNVTYFYQTPTRPSQSYLPASVSMHTPSLQPSLTEFPYSALLNSQLIDATRHSKLEMENVGSRIIHRGSGQRPSTLEMDNTGSRLTHRELNTEHVTLETENACSRLIYGEENIYDNRMSSLHLLNHGIHAQTVKPCNLEDSLTQEATTTSMPPLFLKQDSLRQVVSSMPLHFSKPDSLAQEASSMPPFFSKPDSLTQEVSGVPPLFSKPNLLSSKSLIPNKNGSFYPTSNLSPVSRHESLNKSQKGCPGLKVIANVSQSSPRRHNDNLHTYPGVKPLRNPQVSDAVIDIPTSSYLQNDPHPNNDLLYSVSSAPTSQYYNVLRPGQTDYQQAHTPLTGQNITAGLLSPKSSRVEKAMSQRYSLPARNMFDAFRQQSCNSMITSQSHISSAELIHTNNPHYTVSAQDRMNSSGARIISTTSDSHTKDQANCSIIQTLLANNTLPSAATMLDLRKDNLKPDRHFQIDLPRNEVSLVKTSVQSSSCEIKNFPNKTKASNDLTLKPASHSDGYRIDMSSASNNQPSSERSTDNVHYNGIPSYPFVSEPRSSVGNRDLQSSQICNIMQSHNIDSHTLSADKARDFSSKNGTKQTNYTVSIASPLSQVKRENSMDSLSLEQQPQAFHNPVSQSSSLHLPADAKCLPAQPHLKTGATNQNNCDKPVQEGKLPSSAIHSSLVFHTDHRLNNSRPSWPEDKSLVPLHTGSVATDTRALKPSLLNMTDSGIFSQELPVISPPSLPTYSVSESVQKINSKMSHCPPIPAISNLPQCVRSVIKPCKSQVAVVIAHPPRDGALKSPQPACHVQGRPGCYTVTVTLPSVNHSKSVEVEPDLSFVKSEDGSGTVSLHLKEVIDLSIDNEEMFLPKNPTPNKVKGNIDNVISITQREQSEKVANIVHKDNRLNPVTAIKDHSEKVNAIELKDHCEQVIYINNDENNRQDGRDERESSNSLCEINEDSTIFSDIIKQVLPNECHQTSSHVPVDSVPLLYQSLSESAKSPTDRHLAYPDVTSRKAQRVIAKIKAWTNSEVHDWLKSHHMDKICPNLIGLNGEGLQRLALQYMHDSDSFYSGVKRRLGLSVFQTLVICRSMKELTDI